MKKITGIILLTAMITTGMALAEGETAFLGVSTYPADRAMNTQLGLPRGTGLVVGHVTDDGPSGGIIQVDDILTKFSDQILVNQQQLGVLVRMRKPGETVNIELIRKGEKISVEVQLGSRPENLASMPDFDLPDLRIMGPIMRSFSFDDIDDNGLVVDGQLDFNALTDIITSEMMKNPDAMGNMEEAIGQISNIIKNIDVGSLMGEINIDTDSLKKNGADININSAISTSMVNEDGDTFSFNKNGPDDATLKITDKTGKVVFEGPVNTEEEMDLIPEKYRDKFDKMIQLNITPWKEGGFQPINDDKDFF